MKMKMKICSGVLALLAVMPGYAAAAYKTTGSDTGTEILDYIEQQKQIERANAADPEIKAFQKELAAQPAPTKPVDMTKPAPVAFEGDDILYNQRTGEVYAKGKVKITQQGSRVTADEIKGNTETADLYIEDKVHLLRVQDPRLILDGYKTAYNYQKKTGDMEKAVGKMDDQYIKAERIEFFPGKIVIYNGTMTKCSAKNPDYHSSAEKIEIWPNDHMIMYKAKFWIKNVIVATRDRYVTKLNDKKNDVFPRIGYNSDDGIYVKQKFEKTVAENVNAYVKLNYYSKHDFKNIYGADWNNGDNHVSLEYGSFEDDDNNWVKKEPTIKYQYGTKKLGTTPFNYYLGTEVGQWKDANKSSWHRKYYAGLSRDPITLGKDMYLFTSTEYSITQESYDESQLNSWTYDVTLLKEFNKRLTAFTGYHYTQNTKANSVFNYDSQDYSKKLESGFSYRLDDKNRLVVGQNYDLDAQKVRDVDYYWFHDLHCAEMILRYREKRDKLEIHFEFAPW